MISPINLQLRNLTPYPQPISIGNQEEPLGMQTGGTNWQNSVWDISDQLANAALYNSNVLVFLAAPNDGVSPYQVYTFTNATTFTTVAEVITALNSFNVGEFYSPSGNLISVHSYLFLYSTISLTNFYTAQLSQNTAYGEYGTIIYDADYTQQLIGNLSLINTAVTFWINVSPQTLTKGHLNGNGIWNNTIPVPTNQPIGTIAQIQSNAAKTVYIGFGFDNFGELYVNNQKIVSITTIAEQDAVAANIGAILGGSYPGSAVLFRFWQIVPVQLQAGQNIIQVININTSSSGCFGMEIYDNTAAEIAAATSYADLTMLYRSIDAVGTDLF